MEKSAKEKYFSNAVMLNNARILEEFYIVI